MKLMKIALFAFALTAAAPSIEAHETQAGDLTIVHPRVKVMPAAAKVGAGYVTIVNDGATADHLVSASSPNAGKVEIHEMTMDNGVMRMRALENGIMIPAGETVELAPGGFHIMFKQVVTPFVEGDMVPVTLNFMNAGAVEVQFTSGKGEDKDEMPMKMDQGNMDHQHEEGSQ